jgi:hypothetical protein
MMLLFDPDNDLDTTQTKPAVPKSKSPEKEPISAIRKATSRSRDRIERERQHPSV